jgi:hypothetical protein
MDGAFCLSGLWPIRNGEKENPWIRSGQGGSISGRLSSAQQHRETKATVTQINVLILVMGREASGEECRNVRVSAGQ